ncbi:large subunit ribosomal protein L10 [Clostridium acetobutylicum]|uniref:Large ribosomal subunit protein uL10 n=1 Tax=Clostridium acetobutylicum (strain ATCC 824 / DSM 792 / JCM 1419 / IAM 19013 / LMG 5710 / NBRC 13948 / NRRL B-527 / VKM B-1787 / 2291 / W) TaxID=272562 RepID=RL10_CLOAB|nr:MULTISPECIES: 50S ribosomal protein L10 [Clostridium]Q97EG7.1 RecName: Full=Large ribosomal subunit protein uL10; AltName: Full=50S ribosomal protein L10 [Clostridium acetobutylicum ATCC 824]AAK81083.1 Ribosomal protein L10 [Clostridium acetobutylicum ATCC 824]AEI33415.1 50S ribosomal protein L10 [Clostridium acetobutylicum DSM 1731]AWV82267.1 50S ribosomal protein L10 [Clostridium acetobutylicum]AWV82269.1 50S ribosomal protein L10 [Clostridium acetobutylicum]KHD34759.1 50S ribosomal prot
MVNKNRQLKEQKVAEIKEKMGKTEAMIMVKYQGLNVEEDTELRKALREAGVEYRVYKNSLAVRAINELGYEGIAQYLEGPIAIAMSYDDPTAPARIINDFAKTHKALELVAGYVQGEVFDVNKVKELASVPAKEVLIAKLLGSFKAPLSNFAYLLSAIKDKKEAEEQA